MSESKDFGDALNRSGNDLDLPDIYNIHNVDKYPSIVLDEIINSGPPSKSQTPELSKKIGKKRGPKAGSIRKKTQKQISEERIEDELPREVRENLMNGLDDVIPNMDKKESYAVISLRKKIFRLFKHFGHTKLRPYYSRIPAIGSMGLFELKEEKAKIDYYINDSDDILLPKAVVGFLAGTVENVGPLIAKRFAFLPGSNSLNNISGFKEKVMELADVEGDEGIKDELIQIAIEYDTFTPETPISKLGSKLFSVFLNTSNNNVASGANNIKNKGINL